MDIFLSSATRTSLSSLSQVAKQKNRLSSQLASGLKVQSLFDDPSAFFASQTIRSRARGLSALTSSINQSEQVLRNAQNGLEAMTSLLLSGLSIAEEAAQADDEAIKNSLARQYDEILSHFTKIAQDSGYQGQNLLASEQVLNIAFNETNSTSMHINGQDFTDLRNLNLLKSTEAGHEWMGDEAVNSSISAMKDALNTLRKKSSNFATQMTVLEVRTSFNHSLKQTLEEGADKLVLADMNVVATQLLALQTREQFASEALSIARKNDISILRLFA